MRPDGSRSKDAVGLAGAARPSAVRYVSTEDRRWVFAALSTAAIGAAVIGWVPLSLSAGLAMGDAPDVQIALALAFAGLAAMIGLSLGVLGLVRGRHVAIDIAAAIACVASGVLALVVIVFALSIRW
jgi:hypothetical protein